MHGDLIHKPPSELHALTSPWPFSVWGMDVIGKVSLKSFSDHKYILVAIHYFTKWVEAASYARLITLRWLSLSGHILFVDTGSLMSCSHIEGCISEVRWIHWLRSMAFDIIDHLRTGRKLIGQLRPRIRILSGF